MFNSFSVNFRKTKTIHFAMPSKNMRLGEFGPSSHWLLDNKDLLASCQTPVISFLIPNPSCLQILCIFSSPTRNCAVSPNLTSAFPRNPEIPPFSFHRSESRSNVIFCPTVLPQRRTHHCFFCKKE